MKYIVTQYNNCDLNIVSICVKVNKTIICNILMADYWDPIKKIWKNHSLAICVKSEPGLQNEWILLHKAIYFPKMDYKTQL